MTSASRSDGVSKAARVLMRIFAAAVALIGAIFVSAGGYLALLGGSLYYVLAGFILLASAWLLITRRRTGAWLMLLFVIITLAWSVAEAGTDGWALLPRVAIPLALGAWLLLPFSRRALPVPGMHVRLSRLPGLGMICASLIVALVIGGLVHAIVSRSDPADPRFQTGTGAFPATVSGRYTGPAGDDWPTFGGDKAGSRYSPLDQITAANVAGLKVAWSVDVGDVPYSSASPIKIGNTIFTCNNHGEIFALDAASGRQRWRFDADGSAASLCRGVTHVATAGATGVCAQRIVIGTSTAQLVAVDAASGRPCPGFGTGGRVDLQAGMGDASGRIVPGYYRVTSPPALVRGKLVVGGWISDGQYWGEPSGVIRAFDAVTGKLAWAWDMGRPDRTGAPPPGESYTPATPNSWAPASTDEQLGLVYLPMGNATPDYYGPQRRPFDEQYASSVVALDADTGRPRWSFQAMHHDLWDRDVPAQPTLIDVAAGGTVRQALVQPTKQGELFVLDRATGKPIFPVTEMPAPQRGAVPEERLSPTQPFSNAMPSFRGPKLQERDMWGISPFDQLYCRIKFRQARYDGPNTPPGLTPSVMSPSSFGAMNWGGVSVDPVHGVMIVNSNRFASYTRLLTRAEANERGLRRARPGDLSRGHVGGAVPQEQVPYAAKPGFWLSPIAVPCIDPPYGFLSAVDLATGKLLWSRTLGTSRGSGPLLIPLPLDLPMGTPNHGGSLTTAGGLVFIGASKDGYFRAVDLRTGKDVWRVDLPGGGSSAPFTYRLNGKQYVVISAGGQEALQSKPSRRMIAYALDTAK